MAFVEKLGQLWDMNTVNWSAKEWLKNTFLEGKLMTPVVLVKEKATQHITQSIPQQWK